MDVLFTVELNSSKNILLVAEAMQIKE